MSVPRRIAPPSATTGMYGEPSLRISGAMPRAEVRADSEAREREGPAQEPRRDPVQPGDSDDGDDDPVRSGHVHVSYVAQPPIPAARLHFRRPRGRSSVG